MRCLFTKIKITYRPILSISLWACACISQVHLNFKSWIWYQETELIPHFIIRWKPLHKVKKDVPGWKHSNSELLHVNCAEQTFFGFSFSWFMYCRPPEPWRWPCSHVIAQFPTGHPSALSIVTDSNSQTMVHKTSDILTRLQQLWQTKGGRYALETSEHNSRSLLPNPSLWSRKGA